MSLTTIPGKVLNSKEKATSPRVAVGLEDSCWNDRHEGVPGKNHTPGRALGRSVREEERSIPQVHTWAQSPDETLAAPRWDPYDVRKT